MDDATLWHALEHIGRQTHASSPSTKTKLVSRHEGKKRQGSSSSAPILWHTHTELSMMLLSFGPIGQIISHLANSSPLDRLVVEAKLTRSSKRRRPPKISIPGQWSGKLAPRPRFFHAASSSSAQHRLESPKSLPLVALVHQFAQHLTIPISTTALH